MNVEGLGGIGQDAAKIRGMHQGVGNVIEGGDTSSDTFWIRVVGTLGRN